MLRFAVAALAVSLFVPAIAAADTDAPAERSPLGAFAIATTATAGGLALTGFVVSPILGGAAEPDVQVVGYAALTLAVTTPSAGHLYAGEYRRAALGSAVRLGAAIAVIKGMDMVDIDCQCENDTEIGLTLAAVGAGVLVASTIYDLYDAPRAARRTNERRLLVAPAALAAKDGIAPALALSGRF